MNLGMFAGILNPEKSGKLLLRRRTEIDSIIPGKSFKGNWELPGGGVMEGQLKDKVSYDWPIKELVRQVEREVGISLVDPNPMPSVYLTFFKLPKGGYDLAGVVPIVAPYDDSTKGETIYVSPEELEKLAREFVPADKKQGKDGKGIVSGYGKRMHCMALAALCNSPNPEYAEQAQKMLREIQKGW